MEYFNTIVSELNKVGTKIDSKQFKDIVEQILNTRHVFLAGVGRSGMMIRAFANRLMHLGISTSVVGDATSPHTRENDLLIVGSASGETEILVSEAKKAKVANVWVIAITTDINSTLGRLADGVLVIPAKSKVSQKSVSKQPMGSLFEQSSLMLYDSLVLSLMEHLGENNESMTKRHANIE